MGALQAQTEGSGRRKSNNEKKSDKANNDKKNKNKDEIYK